MRRTKERIEIVIIDGGGSMFRHKRRGGLLIKIRGRLTRDKGQREGVNRVKPGRAVSSGVVILDCLVTHPSFRFLLGFGEGKPSPTT